MNDINSVVEDSELDEDGHDRRRYFRIDDDVLMQIIRLDQARFDEILEQFDSKRESFCFMNSAVLEREKHLSDLRSIQHNNPDVAAYLSYLESRVDMLTNILSGQQSKVNTEMSRVNISAQGIRFYSEKIFDTDDLVELRIALLPGRTRLLIIGTVVWCVEDPKAIGKQNNAIAVDFTYIHEADREVLVKHIHNKQIQQLSIKKLEN